MELLAPAGDLEKLKVAVAFGADAVYMGGNNLGLRSRAQISLDEMAAGIEYAHAHNCKVYICANIFAHNSDFSEMEKYFKALGGIKADALIISDLGVFEVAREVLPNIDIHISTQANTTNYRSAMFWKKMGARRVVLARELSLSEISEIHNKTNGAIELEAFGHGAMCISYSGRCLLSNFMANRDGNRGECAQPCRWKYFITEEQRPNSPMEIFEDNRGSYILNSRDLCMIAHIPEMISAGIISLKIEGRMKTPYYVAATTQIYRQAIDDFYESSRKYAANIDRYMEEIMKISHRGYTTGFYFGKTDESAQVYEDNSYIRSHDFVGIVKEYNPETGYATIQQRNKFTVGDNIDILRSSGENYPQQISEIINENGESIAQAILVKEILRIPVDKPVSEFDILRKKQ